MNNERERVAVLFEKVRTAPYPIVRASPDTRDDIQRVIAELIEIFGHASPAGRVEMVSQVRREFSTIFFWFAREMSELAVRNSSPEAVQTGLLALILENNVSDFRDMLMVLVLVHHSALKLGLDPLQLFDSAAALAVDKQLTEIVSAFPRRLPHDRSLGTFRYEESGQGDSFRYRSVNTSTVRPN